MSMQQHNEMKALRLRLEALEKRMEQLEQRPRAGRPPKEEPRLNA